jgi:hypothetical protein
LTEAEMSEYFLRMNWQDRVWRRIAEHEKPRPSSSWSRARSHLVTGVVGFLLVALCVVGAVGLTLAIVYAGRP